ncbi:hypothetical protein [Pleomorphovibrio marinus]|uniref:hypothetical protein n=1 Tax=Pleomorphovibrio marinus TaxID=2164132 RepID=UPI000E0C6824|nr:hypothetical protein [Pleomorphovibrio marinus]
MAVRHEANLTRRDGYQCEIPRSKFPEASSGQAGAGSPTYSAGQVPETSSGQVMNAEKKYKHMKLSYVRYLLVRLLLSSSIFLASTFFCYSQSLSPTDFIIMEGERLLTIKSKLQEVNKDKRDSALSILIEQAEEQLKSGPYTVVNKKQVPPSGSKNDYISMGPYWWPDPNKEDGLPYNKKGWGGKSKNKQASYQYQETCYIEKVTSSFELNTGRKAREV